MKITESQLRGIINDVIRESVEDGTIDEGRLGNFFHSVGSAAKGMFDTARQDYNRSMAQRSTVDANAADARAREYRQKMNAGYANIPEVQKVAAQYDKKIQMLMGKINHMLWQADSLSAEKKTAMKQARQQYMSKMGRQASKYDEQGKQYRQTAANANDKANRLADRFADRAGYQTLENDDDILA